MKTLSIITVAYNEAKNITRLKRSIDAQRLPKGWRIETVLVDNGSHDDTALIAGRLGYIRVVSQMKGTIAACRNRGFDEASGDLIAYVDADCELGVDWMEPVVEVLEDKSLGIVGWPVVPPTPMTWVQRAWHAHWTNKRGHITSALSGERSMTLITTANMTMTRAAMEQVGGFDASLRSGEDMNFLLRAFHLHIPLMAQPSLHVVHHGEPRSLRAFYHQQRWHCSRNSFLKMIRSGSLLRGANALWFTLFFTMSLTGALLSLLLLCIGMSGWAALGVLPFLLIIWAPAWVIACRAKRMGFFVSLPVLYFVYGWVRMVELFGFHYSKNSWR
ncbi:MAG: glycosyltransferase [Bacteroidia bacterium]|nr:glycosyltransferase [Bacteroidia bacterium]